MYIAGLRSLPILVENHESDKDDESTKKAKTKCEEKIQVAKWGEKKFEKKKKIQNRDEIQR